MNKKTIKFTTVFSVFALLASTALPVSGTYDGYSTGDVDLKNAILALKVCAGINTSANPGADINADSKIGLEKAVYALQYAAGLIQPPTNTIAFINIPVTGSTHTPFQMAISEVTTQQYVDFLNDALSENLIQIGTASTTSWIVSDKNGNPMIDLSGYRVIKDHDNDGIYQLWEMENPLNRCMIQYDKVEKKFSVVNPADVDWNIYFDSGIYPNVVDEITDWAELQDFWTDTGSLEGKTKVSFYETDIHENDGTVKENITLVGHLDTEDCALPAHDEVKKWPASFISYYGAKAFADFYGYQLPSYQEYQWVGKGGYDGRTYSTDDGTVNRANNVYNGEPTRDGGKHKGHAQPVMKFAKAIEELKMQDYQAYFAKGTCQIGKNAHLYF